jgi:hypothetical protein
MAIFGKKKLTLDEILEGIANLSDEDKAKIGEKMKDLYKAEDEREIDKIEEEKTDDGEVKDEKEAEVSEESEEIGKDVEEVEEDVAVDEADAGTEAATQEEGDESVLDETESARDEMAKDNLDEIVHGLTDKVNELAGKVEGLLELRELMEEYTKKQADSFGYKGELLGAKKDFKDMSTEELKARQMKGI